MDRQCLAPGRHGGTDVSIRLLVSVLVTAICLVAFAAPLYADVGVDQENTWESPVAPALTAGNVFLTVANSVQISREGSYKLGILGIATGVAGLVVSGQLDDRSMMIDVPAALSITAGTLSILRQRSINSGRLSISPAHSGRVYGVALNIRF
jgi:hypothetical protein